MTEGKPQGADGSDEESDDPISYLDGVRIVDVVVALWSEVSASSVSTHHCEGGVGVYPTIGVYLRDTH